ncbi:MAG: hypothetical protein MI924_10890 [Chloroflexales bacterium]|nr:hypothetical protein [Chloroflexales bacterium]
MQPSDIAALHDRASRGDSLTEEEQRTLQAWYDEQDTSETALINQPHPAESLFQLQEQMIQAARQLEAITQQITTTIATNNALRLEIARLQARVAQLTPEQAA